MGPPLLLGGWVQKARTPPPLINKDRCIPTLSKCQAGVVCSVLEITHFLRQFWVYGEVPCFRSQDTPWAQTQNGWWSAVVLLCWGVQE